MSRRPQRQRKLREKTRRPRLRLVKNELPPAEIPAIAEPPSRFTMERVLCDFGGALGVNAKRDAWWQAQELAYRAMEMKDGEASIELAMQAVQLHPHCLDALTILAQASSGRNQQELIEHMRNIVDTGRRNLGEKFFEENRGHFWGIVETRPYMRAHAYLAQLFASKQGRPTKPSRTTSACWRSTPTTTRGFATRYWAATWKAVVSTGCADSLRLTRMKTAPCSRGPGCWSAFYLRTSRGPRWR